MPHTRKELLELAAKKKKGIKPAIEKRKHTKLEILRNTAINSFRSDENPTNELIKARMRELRVREEKQRQLAALHNKILQMHQLLPVFSEDDEEEADEDFALEKEDMDNEEEDSEEEIDEEEEEELDELYEEDGENGTVEDLVDLGDDASFDKASRYTQDHHNLNAVEATEEDSE